MKRFIPALAVLICATPPVQSLDVANCGVNSALGVAKILGASTDARAQLTSAYPSVSVSLLDVKRMCALQGIQTDGVKATFAELLQADVPCIVGLKEPEHFLVLLDGNQDEIRVLDGDSAQVQVVPRRELEARYNGYALMPQVALDNAPHLEATFDLYKKFGGLGQKVDYVFPLKNKGKTPLNIEITGTSCGCTAAMFKGTQAKRVVLAPGQSTEVHTSLQVESRAGVQQIVTLKTNDPRRREVYLTVRGQLPPQLALSPPALYVEQRRGEEPSKVLKLIGPQHTRIDRIRSDLPFLQFRIGNKQQDGERVVWPVSVTGFAQAPVGTLNGKLFVRLQDGTELFVPVRGQIEDTAVQADTRATVPGKAPGAAQAALLPRAEDDTLVHIGLPLPSVQAGQVAPAFSLRDMNGTMQRLTDRKDRKHLLLTFFPKCFTGGCANHLSSLRDVYPTLQANNVEVLAVSVDPADGEKGQKAFAKQWNLPFPLIPDTERKLSMLYGAAQEKNQLAARMSVLIDKQGIVRLIDRDVHVSTHGADMLREVQKLQMVK
jgi:peroxiredoxin Q/BCP